MVSISLSILAVCAQESSHSRVGEKSLTTFTKPVTNDKASKEARKEAKKYVKEGWKVAPGNLPLDKQLDRAYQFQYEFDQSGYPQYVVGEAMSVGENYDAAKMQAMELAKLSLVGKLQSEMKVLVQNSLSNPQLSKQQAASITESVTSSVNSMSQKLGKVITLVECYRDTKVKTKEVRVLIAYNSEMAMQAAKVAVMEDLQKKGDALHEKIDEIIIK